MAAEELEAPQPSVNMEDWRVPSLGRWSQALDKTVAADTRTYIHIYIYIHTYTHRRTLISSMCRLSSLGKAESKRAEQQKVMIQKVMTSNN